MKEAVKKSTNVSNLKGEKWLEMADLKKKTFISNKGRIKAINSPRKGTPKESLRHITKDGIVTIQKVKYQVGYLAERYWGINHENYRVESLEGEIWKETEFEGFEISNKGRLKKLATRLTKERVTYGNLAAQKGYLAYTFTKNKVSRLVYIHQLVAIAFLGHVPNQYVVCVDHIDHNVKNNCVENLQEMTHRGNVSKKKNVQSKHIGVSRSATKGNWIARIYVNKENIYLGTFTKEKKAAEAYQKAYKEMVLGQKVA